MSKWADEPAFPTTDDCVTAGLTKRQWFAGMALYGLHAGGVYGRPEYAANMAVAIADALIKALEE